MATRLILTLLALLTGLAAQMGPVHARNRAEGASAVEALAGSVQSARVDTICAAATSTRPASFRQRLAIPAAPRNDPDCAPPAMLRSDRARE